MRVTEGRMLELSAEAMSNATTAAAAAQQVMSSGLRVTLPSDDLAGWTEGQRTAVRTTESQARGTAIAHATDELQTTDGALSTISNALSQARSLAVELSNGDVNASDRAAAAQQILAIRDTIVAAGNTQDSDGNYVLAGSQGGSATPPFSAAGYSGDAVTQTISVGESQTATSSVAGSVLTAAGGVDVIGALNNLAAQLTANSQPGIVASLADLSTATTQVATARTDVGSALSTLQDADAARQSFELRLANTHQTDVEADAITAASNLAATKNALESAQAVATQIVSLTDPRQTGSV